MITPSPININKMLSGFLVIALCFFARGSHASETDMLIRRMRSKMSRDNPGQLPPKKEVIEELYKKFVENFEILHADIPNEEVLRRKWAACGNYYQLKTWLANRIKRASEATFHDPMFRKIMSQTPGQTPSIEVVTDLYNKCVENLALLNVPNEETLLKLWQRFGDLNRIQGWYDTRVRFCKALEMTDPVIIAGAFKAVNACKATIGKEDTTNTITTVRNLFKEFVLKFEKSISTVSAFFSKHPYYKIRDVADKLRKAHA